MNNWKGVYLVAPTPVQLFPEACRGRLVYRAKGSAKRIPYTRINAGLLKRKSVLEQDVPDWL
jgi:hypothetical protein